MRDFLDDLEQRLAQVAAQDAPVLKPSRSPRNFRRRRPAILGGVTAALAATAAAFTMTGTSLADLPILQTDTQDASHLARDLPQAAKAGVDFSQAHAFGTPGGPGYALVNEEQQSICIAVPDPYAPGSYGVSCNPSLADVEREGMSVSLTRAETPSRPGRVITVVVLPEDAEAVTIESNGRRSTPPVESGVAVADLPSGGKMTWSVDGRAGGIDLDAPMKDLGTAQVTCRDGTTRVVRVSPDDGGAAERERFGQAVRDACRR